MLERDERHDVRHDEWHEEWDVAIVGAGPAGLSAAYAASRTGARTIVLERSRIPRYKTCGGGLIGFSLAALPPDFTFDRRAEVDTATFSLRGGRRFTRHATGTPLLGMILREEFDAAFARWVGQAGARIADGTAVREITPDPDRARARVLLADGREIRARVVVGCDGSSGRTSRHVGVAYARTDLALEVELPLPHRLQRYWERRVLLDWGPIPGSYGWVFPKGDLATVGVIARRGSGDRLRSYLRDLVGQLGFEHLHPVHDSGHLTRCRAEDSPLRRGRVLVAGDAAGLLEPWTREGISFALRSGELAGRAAGEAALAADAGGAEERLGSYAGEVGSVLGPEMRAGTRLYRAFANHPWAFHAAVSTPVGWRYFGRLCRGETTFDRAVAPAPVRLALAAMARG